MNATPQIAFNRSYEPCVYATRGKPYLSPDLRNLTKSLDKEVGVGNRVLEDIVDLFDLWLAKTRSRYLRASDRKPPTLHEKPLNAVRKLEILSSISLVDREARLLVWTDEENRSSHGTWTFIYWPNHQTLWKLTGKQAVKITCGNIGKWRYISPLRSSSLLWRFSKSDIWKRLLRDGQKINLLLLIHPTESIMLNQRRDLWVQPKTSRISLKTE